METKNTYNLPVKKQDIKYIIKDSPAHIICKKGKIIYDLRKAIDFTVSENTPIYSVLEGKVVLTYEGVKDTWNKDSEPSKEQFPEEDLDGNYIVIQHPNNELSVYSHLKLGGIIVKEKDKIKTGQLIGYSGNTGWSMGPHVHLMIHDFPKENNGGYRSLEPVWNKRIKEFIEEKNIS